MCLLRAAPDNQYACLRMMHGIGQDGAKILQWLHDTCSIAASTKALGFQSSRHTNKTDARTLFLGQGKLLLAPGLPPGSESLCHVWRCCFGGLIDPRGALRPSAGGKEMCGLGCDRGVVDRNCFHESQQVASGFSPSAPGIVVRTGAPPVPVAIEPHRAARRERPRLPVG